jgi:hypothetical protein
LLPAGGFGMSASASPKKIVIGTVLGQPPVGEV